MGFNSKSIRELERESLEKEVNWAEHLPQLIKMGFPTFDEFKKNPDKWRKRPDEILESADQSTQAFRNDVKTQRYFWEDKYEVDSLEDIERICREEGVNRGDLEMEPIVRQVNEGKVEVLVRFWAPEKAAEKGMVSTNG